MELWNSVPRIAESLDRDTCPWHTSLFGSSLTHAQSYDGYFSPIWFTRARGASEGRQALQWMTRDSSMNVFIIQRSWNETLERSKYIIGLRKYLYKAAEESAHATCHQSKLDRQHQIKGNRQVIPYKIRNRIKTKTERKIKDCWTLSFFGWKLNILTLRDQTTRKFFEL